jgi:hypothetical protein
VLSDIGEMIRTFSNIEGEESKSLKKIRADRNIIDQIIKGFTDQALLNYQEKSNLYFSGKAIILIQSVRFLTDFFNNDCYYKTTYEDHNLFRSKNQWALFKSLCEIE